MKIGFLGMLALIFITLKLVGTITWSWWLVLLPIYGPAALVIGFYILALLGLIGFSVAEERRNKRK